jgi:hypothetical protein
LEAVPGVERATDTLTWSIHCLERVRRGTIKDGNDEWQRNEMMVVEKKERN